MTKRVRIVLAVMAGMTILAGCGAKRQVLQRGWIGGTYVEAKRSAFCDDYLLKGSGCLQGLPPAVKERQKSALLVTRVSGNSPVALAGVEAGDLLLAVNGKAVRNEGELRDIIDGTAPGQSVLLTLYRNGGLLEKELVVGRETYRKSRYISLGFRLGTNLDLVPSPDFNWFSLVSFEKGKRRVSLDSPEFRYVAQLSPAKEAVAHNAVWDFWCGIFGFGAGNDIIAQESAAPKAQGLP